MQGASLASHPAGGSEARLAVASSAAAPAAAGSAAPSQQSVQELVSSHLRLVFLLARKFEWQGLPQQVGDTELLGVAV